MLIPYKTYQPNPEQGVYVAPGVKVVGRVTLGQNVSVWFNAVVRADTSTVSIGSGSNVQDLSLIHCDPGFPAVIGSGVTIGHSCIIHGCTIGHNSLVGMGSTILNGAKIGENSLIGAGSLVTEGKEFPPGSVIMGRPAKVVREVGPRELEMINRAAETYRNHAQTYGAEPPAV